jgi:hypothetical protein
VLLHNDNIDSGGARFVPTRAWQFWHPFVNISVTCNGCSIVCPRHQAEAYFSPLLAMLDTKARKGVSISREDYSVIVIGGAGLEAGERVLDLTTPLAMAGISIFFITSYWSDYILVPLHARSQVIQALEDRGFIFEAEPSGEAGYMVNPASPLLHPRHRNSSSSSSFDFPVSPGTPPPASVSELQTKTFKTLAKSNVAPSVTDGLELVTCGAAKDPSAVTEERLKLGFLRCLTAQPVPSFLSITLTGTESASVTLDTELLVLFPEQGEDLLLGKDGPPQVAITFDLHELPQQSTGIICGVASRLIEGMKGRIGADVFNMSYLSTAKAGHVIVYENELEDAMQALCHRQGEIANGHA